MKKPTPKYQRILLKLSGEALGVDGVGIDPKVLDRTALEIGQLVGIGIQVGLVIGGGNLFRGAALSAAGLDRVTGDHMGMLATVMNALAMRDALERAKCLAFIKQQRLAKREEWTALAAVLLNLDERLTRE